MKECDMEDDSLLRKKEAQAAALRDEASRLVAVASAQGRGLTAEEDARVLDIMSRVRSLEDEIHRLTKHRSAGAGHRP